MHSHVAMLSQAWEYLLSKALLSLYKISSPVWSARLSDKADIELASIAKIRTKAEFKEALSGEVYLRETGMDAALSHKLSRKRFFVEGFCSPCNKKVPMLVDYLFAVKRNGKILSPNWRERVVCPLCGMNNRQRLMAGLIRKKMAEGNTFYKRTYFMEQVTPIFKWAKKEFRNHDILGSEYLGSKYQSGTVIHGVRHEDAMSLSFENDSLDLIVSNDVFEHIPNPMKAFSECLRVLKPGGQLLMTIPFHTGEDISVSRAVIEDNQIKFLLPAEYHGNPVSTRGSLVFTDFGWDFLEEVRKIGFEDVAVEIYASKYYGHYGTGQLVFRSTKPKIM